MRILFCGGRDYADKARVAGVFDKLKMDIMAHGAATGADILCGKEAHKRGIPQIVFPANWKGEGLTAGSIRNQRMLDFFKPDVLVAFPGGTGTEDMVTRATNIGVTVRRVKP